MLLKVPSSSCNAGNIQALKKQCQFLGASSRLVSIRRRNALFSSSCSFLSPSSMRAPLPILAVATEEREPKGFDNNLADRLRLGSLTGDGLSYKEKFIVRRWDVIMLRESEVPRGRGRFELVEIRRAVKARLPPAGRRRTPRSLTLL
ncbi:hypothetical protein CsSME_00006336 [Camellia sinensis var. sinensis]